MEDYDNQSFCQNLLWGLLKYISSQDNNYKNKNEFPAENESILVLLGDW